MRFRMRWRMRTLMGLVLIVALTFKGYLFLQARMLEAARRQALLAQLASPTRRPNLPEPYLIAALADGDPNVRRCAVWALVGMGSTAPELVHLLVGRLESEKEEMWRARGVPLDLDPAEALVWIKLPASTIAPLLRKAMASPDRNVRSRAMYVLSFVAERSGRGNATLERLLVAALQDREDLRHSAIQALIGMGSTAPELVRVLVGRLESETEEMSWRDRRRPGGIVPAWSLMRIKLPASTIAPLLPKAMASPDPWIRFQATSVLMEAAGRPGREDATLERLLLVALQDREIAIRMPVPGVLAKLGADARRRAVAILLEQLRQPDRLGQFLATKGLVCFGDEASPAVAILSARLRGIGAARPATQEVVAGVTMTVYPGWASGEDEERAWALYLLGRLGPLALPTVPEFVRAMTSAESEKTFRRDLREGFHVPQSIWHWIEVDPDIQRTAMTGYGVGSQLYCLRGRAAATLGRIGPEAERQAVERLIAMLRGEDEADRLAAADALGALGPTASAAFPALLAEAEKDRPAPRKGADWSAMFQLTTAMRAVCQNDDPRLAEALVRLLRSKDGLKRSAAATNLSHLQPPPASAIPSLVAARRDEVQSVRSRVAEALGRVPVSAVLDAVRDEDEMVRNWASDTLAFRREEARRVVPKTIQQLRSESPSLRGEAAKFLGSYGPLAQDAIPALREARHDESGFVRDEVEKALKAVCPAEAVDPAQSPGG